MNITQWKNDLIAAPQKKAIPVLSFPCIQLLGITVNDLTSDSDLQAKGMKMVADRCDTGASVSMMDLSVEAEAFGSKVRIDANEVPTVLGAIVEEPEDAEALAVPAVGAGRTGLYIDAIAKAAKLITDRPIFAGCIGPFSLAGRLIGMSEIMYACYDDPDMVKTVLEKATAFITEYARGFKAAGASGLVIAEPAAGILSAQMCAEFSAPYCKAIVDAVQDESFGVIYHNCGNAAALMLPEILSCGAIGYHFGDAVNMAEICPKMPADVLVMGNVSPSQTFRAGNPDKMRSETLAVMEACCKYPNFVISSGCDIPPATPWENIDAFFAAVSEFYGK